MLALTTEGAADFGKEVDSSLLAAHVARRLRDLDANEIDVRPHLVTFKGDVFLTNWSVLVNFGLGDLTVDPDSHEIRYRLSYQQLVICSAIIFAVICLCTLIFSVIHGTFPSTWTVLAMFLAWPCLGFINVSIGVWRFERFLDHAVATAPHIKPNAASAK